MAMGFEKYSNVIDILHWATEDEINDLIAIIYRMRSRLLKLKQAQHEIEVVAFIDENLITIKDLIKEFSNRNEFINLNNKLIKELEKIW